MATSGPARAAATHPPGEDPLLYLPCSAITEHARGDIIYAAGNPSTHIYVVISGAIQVSRQTERGRLAIVDIYRSDDFFGEGALVKLPCRGEQAMALQKTMLMTWKAAVVEDLMEQRPELALAFVKMMARREFDLGARMESLSRDTIAVRLARSLLRFAERLGTRGEDDVVRMRGFTHEFLAQYVGTSREVVNTCMTQFRRQQLLTYSRKEIAICRGPLIDWIRLNP